MWNILVLLNNLVYARCCSENVLWYCAATEVWIWKVIGISWWCYWISISYSAVISSLFSFGAVMGLQTFLCCSVNHNLVWCCYGGVFFQWWCCLIYNLFGAFKEHKMRLGHFMRCCSANTIFFGCCYLTYSSVGCY
jgi:hypothetical protein